MPAARGASNAPPPPPNTTTLQAYCAPPWRPVKAPRTVSAFREALERAVRVFDAWTSAAPPECHALGEFVVFSRGAPVFSRGGSAVLPAYWNLPRSTRVARTSTGELRIVTRVGGPQTAAVASIRANMYQYCKQPENRPWLGSGGAEHDFPGVSVDLDACICLGHRPRFIFEFDHRHRGPEQLQRLVCQYFADMYVSAVLIMKVYRPSASDKLACFAILYTRGEAGGVPCRAWDLGAQGVQDATKRAFGLGAPGNADQDALGGVPAATWVRHSCAPVPAFEGSMQMEMHYDDPPVCSIEARHLFYIPDGGKAVGPEVMPTRPLIIDLGEALGEFLVSTT